MLGEHPGGGRRVAAARRIGRAAHRRAFLCGQTLFHTLYTDEGKPDGAVRFTDPAVIRDYEVMVRALYEAGEDLDRFQLGQ